MAFTVKDWKNAPDPATPISAESLEDLEERLSDYTDSVVVATSSPTIPKVVHSTGTKTIAATDFYKTVDVTGAATVTIPDPPPPGTVNGTWFEVRKTTSAAVTITIAGTGLFEDQSTGTQTNTITLPATTGFRYNTYRFINRILPAGGAHVWVVSGGEESMLNKDVSATLGGVSSSDIKYPSQKAVKTYVDTAVGVTSESPINVTNPIYAGGAGTGKTGAQNRAAIQAALDAAAGIQGAEVLIPATRLLPSGSAAFFSLDPPSGAANVNGITVKNQTTLILDGNIKCTGTWSTNGTAAIGFEDSSTNAFPQNGGMRGGGTVYCDRKPQISLDVNAWRNGTFYDIIFCDPIDYFVRVRNTSTNTVFASDTLLFEKLMFKNDTLFAPGNGFTAAQRPKRIFLWDGSFNNGGSGPAGVGIVSDSWVKNCSTLGSLRPDITDLTGVNGTGGWAVEVIDCNRIEFESNRWYNHQGVDTTGTNQALYNGAFLLRALNKDCSRIKMKDTYVEATVTAAGKTPDPGWVFTGLRMVMEAGVTARRQAAGSINTPMMEHCQFEGYEFSINAAISNNRRWVAVNEDRASPGIPAGGLGPPKIKNNFILRPLNTLSATAQVNLNDTGTANNVVQTMNSSEVTPTPMWTSAAGTGNALVSMKGNAQVIS